jgi:hypothetical protein
MDKLLKQAASVTSLSSSLPIQVTAVFSTPKSALPLLATILKTTTQLLKSTKYSNSKLKLLLDSFIAAFSSNNNNTKSDLIDQLKVASNMAVKLIEAKKVFFF